MYRSSWAPVLLLLFRLGAITAQEAGSTVSPAGQGANAHEDPFLEEVPPGMRDRAVVLDINARIVEQNKVEVWNESHKRVTIPGRPVGLKLVGANIVVAIQFIPYLSRSRQNVLVAQGQIWVDIPNQGIRYQTTMQTIPLEFEEPVYFFPLGSSGRADEATIEIMLILRPYKNSGLNETGTAETENQAGSDPP
jgi:hypothetical protein